MKETDKLRERAEKELQKADKKPRIFGSESELVHELQVHQAELEMQNEELRNSQIELSDLYEEYHELYNEAPVGYFSLDNKGIIRNVNIKGAELLGLEKNRIIGMGFILFIPSNYQTKYYRSINKAGVMREIQEVELKLKREKSLFYVQMEIIPIHDKPDEKYRIIITDITERKKAEEVLQKSEANYRNFFNNPLMGFALCEIITDDNGEPVDFVYLQVNKAFEKFTGLKKEEVLNKRVTEVLEPEEVADIIKIYGKVALTGESANFEYLIPSLNKYYEVAAFSPRKGRFIAFFTDITQRKQAEIALRESEERYHSLFENNHAAMLLIDPETGKIVDSNPAASSFYGYSKEELKRMKITEINTLDEKQTFFEMQKAETEQNTHFLFEHRLANGEIRDVDVYSGPIIFKGRKFLYSIIHDITKQIRIEKDLKDSEEKFRALFEQSNDAIVIADFTTGRYLECNKKTEEYTGYSKDELLSKELGQITSDKQRKRALEHFKSLSNGENIQFESEILTKNKEIIPADIKASVMEIQGLKYIQIIIRDISIRKYAEKIKERYKDHLEKTVKERTMELEEAYESLKRSEEKYRELVENANSSIIRLDKKGIITFFNEFAEKFFGFSKEEILGKNAVGTIVPKIESSGRDTQKIINNILIEPRSYSHVENENITKDGKIVWVSWANKGIYNEKSEPVGVLSVGTDITERKKAEEKLKETVEELERSNEELQRFTFITSHDLQEPIRTIVSFTQLLQRRYEGRFDSDADEFMDFVVDASIRMKDMIQGLLEYSSVRTQGEEFKDFNAEEALKKALDNLKLSSTECEAEITHDVLPVIHANENQITRLFQNLISNALKFRKEGVPPKIHISTQRKNNEWIFSIEDNGIGMETQYIDKIFEVFRRLHTIDAYKGTGIGLAIVERIIINHGGRIWVESEYGVGSTFYFTIPVEPANGGRSS